MSIPQDFYPLLDRYFEKSKSVLVIGAMDGIFCDEFYPFIVKYGNQLEKALFVEPIPWWFEKLKENYKAFNHFEFENSAIALTDGTEIMVTIPPNSGLPDWFDGCSMFGRTFTNLIDGWTDERVESYKKFIDISTITISTLFSKYSITSLDMLKIDTEGQDWNVLQQIDLQVYRPHYLQFEAFHLSTDSRRLAVEHCTKAGYNIIFDDDVVAATEK